VIARPEQLVAILDAIEGRFGDAELLCVHPRPDAAAIRIVVRAVLGARGRLSIRPPLTLHGPSGNEPTDRTEMISNGLASLFGDWPAAPDGSAALPLAGEFLHAESRMRFHLVLAD